jgi:hypothetical protein
MGAQVMGGLAAWEQRLSVVALAAAVGLLACAGTLPRHDVGISATPATRPAKADADRAAETVDPALVVALRDQIRDSEYWASENRHGLQAPNRRHGLRTYFEPTGIRVVDRVAPGSDELVSLALEGWGRPGAIAVAAAGEVTSHQGRVEIRRPGVLEWYENAEAGLEQGFTIEASPSGTGSLVVDLRVSGAVASLDDQDVVFRTASGRRLRYGAFIANDANGKILEARLEVPARDRLRLRVEDSDAVYPIVLDPRITDESASASKLHALTQAGAYLGVSVAGAGDVDNDGFDDVIAGAHRFDANTVDWDAGMIIEYEGSAQGIVDGQAAAWGLTVEQTNAQLGVNVDGAGDVNCDGIDDVIVGARYYDNGQSNEGVAFIFHGVQGSGLATCSSIFCADAFIESNQANAYLGQFVAGVGNVDRDPNDPDNCDDVMVGAFRYEKDNSVYREGAAFVFLGRKEHDGIVGYDLQTPRVADPDLLLNPDTAIARIVSNQYGAELGIHDSGAGDVNGDGFDDIIVGARYYDTDPNANDKGGAAFVFHGSADGIEGTGPLVWLTPADAQTRILSSQSGSGFGVRTSGAGDVNADGFDDVIVGAYAYDNPSANEGAAFVFHGSAAGLLGGLTDGTENNSNSGLYGNLPGARMGISVAGAGDVNNDGYDDVIVGADEYDSLKYSEGAAFLFLGGPSGLVGSNPETAYALLHPAAANLDQEFGYAVDGAGDVNGDGYADVIVGDLGDDVGASNAGAFYVFSGAELTQAGSTTVTFQQTAPFDNSGWISKWYQEVHLEDGFPDHSPANSFNYYANAELNADGIGALVSDRSVKSGVAIVRPSWTIQPTGNEIIVTIHVQSDNDGDLAGDGEIGQGDWNDEETKSQPVEAGTVCTDQSGCPNPRVEQWLYLILRQDGVDYALEFGSSGRGDGQIFFGTRTITGNADVDPWGYFLWDSNKPELDLSAGASEISVGFFACCAGIIQDRNYTSVAFTVSGVAVDTDGDGANDPDDSFPTDPSESSDLDGDRIGNNADLDDDGDTWSDADETTCNSDPLNDASVPIDTDGDLSCNLVDDDDDNDGYSDVQEAEAGTDPNDASDFPTDLPALGPFGAFALIGLLSAGAFWRIKRRRSW